MWQSLKRLFSKAPREAPLSGAPSRPRAKTYSADSGYVFQHSYLGYRPSDSPEAGTEHLFQVCTQGRPPETVCIFAPNRILDALSETAGRPVGARERYALVKMTLFALLDTSTPTRLRTRETLSVEEAESIWETLDL